MLRMINLQTPGKGWGVFAGALIPRGAFIIEYIGEIIDEAESDARLEACRLAGETHYYLMEIDADTYIDARHKVRDCSREAVSCQHTIQPFR